MTEFQWDEWWWFQRKTPWYEEDPDPSEIWFSNNEVAHKALVLIPELRTRVRRDAASVWVN